jgi:hypothetical protein
MSMFSVRRDQQGGDYRNYPGCRLKAVTLKSLN